MNNVERFAHLDWLEQKLMQNLPVVTNAFSSVSCVLLTQIILEKNIKRIKCHSERMIEVGVSKGEMMQKRRLLDIQRGFLQTPFQKIGFTCKSTLLSVSTRLVTIFTRGKRTC